MIDSHCHLDHEPLLSDLKNVIKRSKDVGIKKLLTISTSHESFDKIKKIINEDEMIYGTIGVHPHETTDNKITTDFIIKNLFFLQFLMLYKLLYLVGLCRLFFSKVLDH